MGEKLTKEDTDMTTDRKLTQANLFLTSIIILASVVVGILSSMHNLRRLGTGILLARIVIEVLFSTGTSFFTVPEVEPANDVITL